MHFFNLDNICDYFGVKIAIYFAWLGHYTKALTIPAFFGFFMWISYYGKDQATEDMCFVVFALFNVLWATLYLESWKRHCAELAYRWGTLDSQNELLAEPRPLFSGPLIRSPVTGRMEPSYPCWKRNLFRYCVSLPVIAFCLFIVFIVMFLIFELQTWWDSKVKALEYPFWMTFLPKVLLGLVINVLDGVYHRIALWLNNKVPVCKFIFISLLYCLLSARYGKIKRAISSIINYSTSSWKYKRISYTFSY